MNYGGECKSTGVAIEKNSVATELMQYAGNVASQAEKLSGKVSEKLSPVMSERPAPGQDSKVKEHREYPPLFDDLRSKLSVIQSALENIEHCMSRTEL